MRLIKTIDTNFDRNSCYLSSLSFNFFYNKDNLPAEATRTWVTKTIAETDSDGTTHYITKLADAYKVSGDSFYMQDGKAVLPLGTLTVEETKAPNGYLLDGAYMQAGDKSEQIKDLYVTQITEDGDLAVLTGSNHFSVSDKVIRGGVKDVLLELFNKIIGA